MAKKTIAAHAEKQALNDEKPVGEGRIKFICKFAEYRFRLDAVDSERKRTFHTDANGNGKIYDHIEYKFTQVAAHKNADGKVDTKTAFCFFIADPEKHGSYYKEIVDKLTAYTKNPINRMYTEDGYFKDRNPEAFRIAKEKVEMEGTIDKLAQENADLKKRLGFKQ